MQLSDLINNLPPYHFADAKKKIAERRAAGVDVISLSMGDPDLPAPQSVIDRLCLEMQNTENHRYPEYFGMRALHLAFAAWFKRRFDVRLTPERDMLPLLGSKEGLAYVATAVLNAGDISLIPDPYYPVYVTGSTSVGAIPYTLPLREQNSYLPDLDSIPADVLAKARLLWLNYPNNPTAACADSAFFAHAVDFAQRHNLVIVHDMAYAEVYFDDYRPMSILQVPGASEVAVELHSLSKTYNMAGFRVGMLVGNAELVNAVGRLKSGMRAHKTTAGLYVWATVPGGYSARDFASWLFDQSGVFLTPGTNFGDAGEGYVRISMTAPEERIATALKRMKEALS